MGEARSARANLRQREAHPASGYKLSRHGKPVWNRPHLEQFCAQQLERILRVTGRQIDRVQQARRDALAKARKQGEELVLDVRGSVGSDAHPDDDSTPTPLV